MNNYQILLGKDGIKSAYELSLKNKYLNIQCLSKNYEKIIGDYFDKDFYPRLLKSKITTREIVSNNPDNIADAKKKDGVKNKVRFTENESESDLIIGDREVILISYNSKMPLAIMIENAEIVESLKILFEKTWESCNS